MPRVVDLTLPTRKHWRWFARVMLWHDFADGDSFRHSFMTINSHGFTHADAPNHFLPERSEIAGVPGEKYIGEAGDVDLSHRGAYQPVSGKE